MIQTDGYEVYDRVCARKGIRIRRTTFGSLRSTTIRSGGCSLHYVAEQSLKT